MVKYNYLKNFLIKEGVPENKISIVPHWIDYERIHKQGRRRVKIRGVDKDDRVFVFFGRTSPEKGPMLMLKSFKIATDEIENAKLVFVGPKFDKEKLDDFCRTNGLSNSVFFLGPKPHHTVHKWLSIADCIVFPNLYFNYEWGMLEAMCTGKPIVATDVTATREILKHGENALLARPEPHELAKRMVEVMNNKPMAAKIGRKALETIKRKHGMKNLDRYVGMLEEIA
jgi:glycosyltransferase involved in cell wall biosynthesis